MQIWAETGKSALPIHNYSQILYQFLTFTQNLKRSQSFIRFHITLASCVFLLNPLLFFGISNTNNAVFVVSGVTLLPTCNS